MVAEAVAALMVQYPGLTFGMKVADNQKVAQMIAAAEVDFGFMLDASDSAGCMPWDCIKATRCQSLFF